MQEFAGFNALRSSTANETHRSRRGDEVRIVDVVAWLFLHHHGFDEVDDLAREAPCADTSRRECSTVENRQVRIWPSAVSRMREQAPQKGSVTGAMMPISPGAPSAKR